jgi:splicing factor U2AF subunit
MEGGAEYLATIFGTEKDKYGYTHPEMCLLCLLAVFRVNCPFYFKIGACRHGDKCERRHNKPSLSQTLLITHMWPNPLIANAVPPADEKTLQSLYDEVYILSRLILSFL